MGIVKGKKLMLFVKDASGNTYHSIGFATNHTFSTSASTIDISHKDLADNTSGSGKWVDQDIDTYSWNITSEHFYADTASGVTEAELFGYFAAGTVLEVKFGLTDTSSTGVPTDGWVPSTGTMLSGKVIITSFDINAPVDDNATFSVTFTGKGPVAIA